MRCFPSFGSPTSRIWGQRVLIKSGAFPNIFAPACTTSSTTSTTTTKTVSPDGAGCSAPAARGPKSSKPSRNCHHSSATKTTDDHHHCRHYFNFILYMSSRLKNFLYCCYEHYLGVIIINIFWTFIISPLQGVSNIFCVVVKENWFYVCLSFEKIFVDQRLEPTSLLEPQHTEFTWRI